MPKCSAMASNEWDGISGKSFAEGFLQVVETLRIKRPFLKTLDVELHGSGAEEEQKA